MSSSRRALLSHTRRTLYFRPSSRSHRQKTPATVAILLLVSTIPPPITAAENDGIDALPIYEQKIQTEYIIGGQAQFSQEEFLSTWSPTFVEFLNAKVGPTFDPPINFSLEALSTTQVLTGDHNADFLFLNPGLMLCADVEYGAPPFLTVRTEYDGRAVGGLGGVIFARADNEEVKKLEDIVGKVISEGDVRDLGSAQLAHHYLFDKGIDHLSQAKKVIFRGTDQTKIVMDVLNGVADVGFVATGVLEHMQQAAQLDLAAVKVLEAREGVVGFSGHPFPFVVSTNLVPEWPLSAFNHVHRDVSTAVMTALTSIQSTDRPAQMGHYMNWDTPDSYVAVFHTMEEMGILLHSEEGEYRDIPAIYECILPGDEYLLAQCPEDYQLLPTREVGNSCKGQREVCEGEALCLCAPCRKKESEGMSSRSISISVLVALAFLIIVLLLYRRRSKTLLIAGEELSFKAPPEVLGRSTCTLVLKGEYRGTAVAVKALVAQRDRMQDAYVLAQRIALPPAERKAAAEREWLDATVVSQSDSREAQANGDEGRCWGLSGGERAHVRSRNRFLEKVAEIARIRHPSVTTVFGAVIGRRREPLLVMEYMELGCLASVLQNRHISLTGENLHSILLSVVQGMRFLHNAKPPVLHKDLRTSNILVNAAMHAKVSDIGRALSRSAGRRQSVFQSLPPELAAPSPRLPFSPATDVFAFGVVLLEVVHSGRAGAEQPLGRPSLDYLDEGAVEIVVDAHAPPSSLCAHTAAHPPLPPAPEFAPALAAMIRRCLATDPAARPSFQTLQTELVAQEEALVAELHRSRTCGLPSPPRTPSGTPHANRSVLESVYPSHIVEAMLNGDDVKPDERPMVTVFFSDIVGFTTICSTLGATKVMEMLNRLYVQLDALAAEHGVFKIETIGDAYMAVTNLVEDQSEDHALRIAQFAVEAVQAAAHTLIDEEEPAQGFIAMRAGFHSGPVVGQMIGTRQRKYTLFGDTVNMASRMESTCVAGRVQCAKNTARLLREQGALQVLDLEHRGIVEVKGKGGLDTYYVCRRKIVGGSFRSVHDGNGCSLGEEGPAGFHVARRLLDPSMPKLGSHNMLLVDSPLAPLQREPSSPGRAARAMEDNDSLSASDAAPSDSDAAVGPRPVTSQPQPETAASEPLARDPGPRGGSTVTADVA